MPQMMSFVEPGPSSGYETPILDVIAVQLQEKVTAGVYEGSYPVTESGAYRVLIYAEGNEGNQAKVARDRIYLYLPVVLKNR